MGRETVAWVGFWAGFGLLDYWADRRGKSLCSSVRWLFRSHTPRGRTALAATYTVGAVVLYRHLAKPIAEALADT